MTYTFEQGVAWAKTSAGGVRTNWDQWCEALMWWMLGGVTRTFESATDAFQASTIAGSGDAPVGTFIHIATPRQSPDGHIAVSAGGGWGVMASAKVNNGGTHWGFNVGVMPIARYLELTPGAFVRGWSWDHGGSTFANVSTAGGIVSSFVNPLSRIGFDMPELYSANMPAVVPPKYLAVNKGLSAGKPTYFLLGGSAGTPFNAKVTQDQTLAGQWARMIGGPADNPGSIIVPLSWGYADQLYDQALTPLSVGAVGGGDSSAIAAAIRQAVPSAADIAKAVNDDAAARLKA